MRNLVSPVQSRISEQVTRLWRDTRTAASRIPEIRIRPRFAGFWMLDARVAQGVLLCLLVLMPVWIPAAVDGILAWIFSPTKETWVFGLIQTSSEHPWLEGAQLAARLLLWTGSLVAVLWLLLLHLPTAVVRAVDRARELESSADALARLQPGRSLVLYRRALAMTPDPAHSQVLEAKITQFDPQLASPATSQTVVLSRVQSAPPPVAGRYRPISEIGRGAMGVIYRAHDERLGRDVALKELPLHLAGEGDTAERFRREARALARLNHPHIVQVYDLVEEQGRAWIAMELVEGEDLDRLLRRERTLSPEVTLPLAIDLADALGYAHDSGVVHRDFKPGNVLINTQGAAKVTDFGLAKMADASQQTRQGTVMGSPAYMSPEQAQGLELDQRTDLYSLGVTLYRMLGGQLPFAGDTAAVIAQVLSRDPPPLGELAPQLPPGLAQLVMDLLAKDREARPASMSVLVERLREVMSTI